MKRTTLILTALAVLTICGFSLDERSTKESKKELPTQVFYEVDPIGQTDYVIFTTKFEQSPRSFRIIDKKVLWHGLLMEACAFNVVNYRQTDDQISFSSSWALYSSYNGAYRWAQNKIVDSIAHCRHSTKDIQVKRISRWLWLTQNVYSKGDMFLIDSIDIDKSGYQTFDQFFDYSSRDYRKVEDMNRTFYYVDYNNKIYTDSPIRIHGNRYTEGKGSSENPTRIYDIQDNLVHRSNNVIRITTPTILDKGKRMTQHRDVQGKVHYSSHYVPQEAEKEAELFAAHKSGLDPYLWVSHHEMDSYYIDSTDVAKFLKHIEKK